MTMSIEECQTRVFLGGMRIYGISLKRRIFCCRSCINDMGLDLTQIALFLVWEGQSNQQAQAKSDFPESNVIGLSL